MLAAPDYAPRLCWRAAVPLCRIHGAAADPAKLAEYRALLRVRRGGRKRYGADAFRRFSRLLLKASAPSCPAPCCCLLALHPLLGLLPEDGARIGMHAAMWPAHAALCLPCSPCLQLPEHTAGVDQKEYPNDWEHWGNAGELRQPDHSGQPPGGAADGRREIQAWPLRGPPRLWNPAS